MKFTQKKCSIRLPKTKSANALRNHNFTLAYAPSYRVQSAADGKQTYRSCDTVLNSDLFSGFVCIRKEAVRTNWPTVALKPERKALKGWSGGDFVSVCSKIITESSPGNEVLELVEIVRATRSTTTGARTPVMAQGSFGRGYRR